MSVNRSPLSGSSDLPAYPFQRDMEHPFDPSPQITLLRHERPISKVRMWNGREAWLVTRMQDVRALLSDDRFSSVPHHENYPTLSAAHEITKKQDGSFLRKDKPAHTVERRLWQPFFNATHIAALRPRIVRIVEEAIDDLIANGPPADLVKHVALAVPSRVISYLLAVPDEDHEFFQKWSIVRANVNATVEESAGANKALEDYWRRLSPKRLENPGEDLVSQLIVSEVRSGRLTVEDVVAMAQLILFAGHGTTADMIALGTLTLLEHPHVIAELKANPAITTRVVEELLRYLTITHHGLQRVALADVEIGGVTIRAGDGVIVHLASANRDESAFEGPDKFDHSRQLRTHVAFGAGSHACIGAPLARTELQIVFDTLFRRIPDLRVAVPLREVRFRTNGLFYGLHELPVAWG